MSVVEQSDSKMDIFKQCPVCQELLPATSEWFYRRRSRLRKRCKQCEESIKRGHLVVLDFRKCGEERRKCSRCGECLPLSAYSVRQTGYRVTICKACCAARTREYHAANIEKVHERKRLYRQKNIDAVKASKKRYFEQNADRLREKSRLWNNNNLEHHRLRTKEWRKNNPEKARAAKQLRRARKVALPNAFTEQDWLRAVDYFGGCCAVCGRKPDKWTVLSADHWISIADPRLDNPGTVAWNIIPLCHCRKYGVAGCNNSKRSADPIRWLIRRLGEYKAEQKLAEIAAYFNWVRQQDGT